MKMYKVFDTSPYSVRFEITEENRESFNKMTGKREVPEEEMVIYKIICDAAQRWMRKNRESFRREFVFRKDITRVTREAVKKKDWIAKGAFVNTHLWARICNMASRYFGLDYRKVTEFHDKGTAIKVHEEIQDYMNLVDPSFDKPHIQRW